VYGACLLGLLEDAAVAYSSSSMSEILKRVPEEVLGPSQLNCLLKPKVLQRPGGLNSASPFRG